MQGSFILPHADCTPCPVPDGSDPKGGPLTHVTSLSGRHEARTRGLDGLVDLLCRLAARLRGFAAAAAVVCVVVTAGIVMLTLSRAAAPAAATVRVPPAPAVSSCRRAVAAADQVLEQAGLIGGDIDLVHVSDALDAYRAVAATCKTSQPPR